MRRIKIPFESFILYLGFAATGVGVALPGILLPALMQEWKLQDSRAGLLFLCAWAGSSVGALLVRGSLRLTLAGGGILIALASISLASLPAWNFPWAMSAYGLGLGLTMTSISLLRQEHASLRGNNKVEMVRLNLLWAAGACACPSLARRALRSGNTHPLLIGLGVVFGAFVLWSMFSLKGDSPLISKLASTTNQPKTIFAVPLPLLIMLFLVTGIEAATGGWLATYTKREHHDLALTVAAPTCLWAGLLLSRAVWSLRATEFRVASIIRGSLWLLSAATLLLVFQTSGFLTLAAAFGIGFSLGPVYPLLLAQALGFQSTGTLFFIAGLGSAALPWLTGVISQLRSSLRDGLLVPVTAAFAMLALSLFSSGSQRSITPPRTIDA